MGSLSLPPFKINEVDLAKSLHESCQFGAAHRYGKAPTETGMARLSLDDSDKQVRDWFISYAKSLGLKTSIDQMGNLFAIRPGKKNDLPPVMMGSHLDTQPTGGRYDGILGVISGLEVLRTLNDHGYESAGPIGVVNWTNEEGARFPKMAVSSGVWADVIPLETAWDLREVLAANPKSMKEELDRIGYCGEQPASYKSNPFAAHFELHIEQGPILEDECLKIGVVHGVQAFKWFNITVKGRDSHAGTTPLYARKDPVLSASKMLVAANTIAKKFDGLATTGIFTTDPGTVNTMAHTVKFTLDLRHVKDEILAEMVKECEAEFQRISQDDSEKGCEVEWELLVDSPAVKFNEECISVVEQSAANVCSTLPQNAEGKLWRPMISGAGHDSCYTNRVCPTSMIFTPTRSGISHNPTEYCSPEDCALGASVLLGAVLRYDKLRANKITSGCPPRSYFMLLVILTGIRRGFLTDVEIPTTVFWIIFTAILLTMQPFSIGMACWIVLIIHRLHLPAVTVPEIHWSPTALAVLSWIGCIVLSPMVLWLIGDLTLIAFVCYVAAGIIMRDKVYGVNEDINWTRVLGWGLLLRTLHITLPPYMPWGWYIFWIPFTLFLGIEMRPNHSAWWFICWVITLFVCRLAGYLVYMTYFRVSSQDQIFPFNLFSHKWKMGSPQWCPLNERPADSNNESRLCDRCHKLTSESKLIMGATSYVTRLIEWHNLNVGFHDFRIGRTASVVAAAAKEYHLCVIMWHSMSDKRRNMVMAPTDRENKGGLPVHKDRKSPVQIKI
ncbi:n-carbamoyl-amino acid hydrolase [Fusarium beomiforme]|uniref:N-carbamoyl-amino acid hydrolase n=1 Tax=Fusarium beomiforme TaxID=44412 RepID=A0A9P5DSP3_9HYPO|nr:n-carbamoyl-amino acid hydrolase [Fusarium beomiforme]